jgi:hypothetical protein
MAEPANETRSRQDSENSDSNNEANHETQSAEIKWQETLLNLLAVQQQQIAELAKQTKMAIPSSSSSTPNLPVAVADGSNTHVSTSGHGYTAFKLTSYDPDNSAYAVSEWLEDATKLKEELNVSDNLMIAKASEALKNRGNRYCCDWRPIRRTWENFCADLITAFPDKETPGARAFKAATLRSHDCDSLCDYGNQKLRSIYRFYDQLPWDKVLSMIEYGLDHAEARASLHIQVPKSERELMTILSEFDARRAGSSKVPRYAESTGLSKWRSDRKQRENRDIEYAKPSKMFKGSCFKCGRQGHQQHECKAQKKDASKEVNHEKSETDTSIPSCNHCRKIGHTEANCWYKHGKPKKTFVLKK